MLCAAACHEIVASLHKIIPLEQPTRQVWKVHQQTYLRLHESAKIGCYICGIVWNDIKDIDGSEAYYSDASPATWFDLQISPSEKKFWISIDVFDLPTNIKTRRERCRVNLRPSFSFSLQPRQSKFWVPV
jgi:hypothetical protein